MSSRQDFNPVHQVRIDEFFSEIEGEGGILCTPGIVVGQARIVQFQIVRSNDGDNFTNFLIQTKAHAEATWIDFLTAADLAASPVVAYGIRSRVPGFSDPPVVGNTAEIDIGAAYAVRFTFNANFYGLEYAARVVGNAISGGV